MVIRCGILTMISQRFDVRCKFLVKRLSMYEDFTDDNPEMQLRITTSEFERLLIH